ncbi:hypothetical protein VTK73DRAFT_9373 [Phialemonium thermophilum]|uniref:Uncharacterized protein n=1 Tax=Phialemonium thermophilum TaxID=223376 RepID=A0ABR3W3D4_9PEZI
MQPALDPSRYFLVRLLISSLVFQHRCWKRWGSQSRDGRRKQTSFVEPTSKVGAAAARRAAKLRPTSVWKGPKREPMACAKRGLTKEKGRTAAENTYNVQVECARLIRSFPPPRTQPPPPFLSLLLDGHPFTQSLFACKKGVCVCMCVCVCGCVCDEGVCADEPLVAICGTKRAAAQPNWTGWTLIDMGPKTCNRFIVSVDMGRGYSHLLRPMGTGNTFRQANRCPRNRGTCRAE